MKKSHPFYMLLAFLLMLGIVGAGIQTACSLKVSASLCEVEENCLEDCMEELSDNLSDDASYTLVPDLSGLDAVYPIDFTRRLTRIVENAFFPYSIGWFLPLRI